MTSEYFDETIFTFGESISPYKKINVFNTADAFLVARQNIQVGYDCATTEESDNTPSVNLNPRGPCMGINIYSLGSLNKKIEKCVDFNQISVYDGETTLDLKVGDHIPGSIYTVGSLSPFESAIMIKFYAINHSDVYITRHLYNYIKKYFQDNRSWFNYNSLGIVQNDQKELIFEDDIINVPINTLSGDYIGL